MLSMALALAASMTLAQAPAFPADIAPIAAQGACLPQMDPKFVLFVPEAPSSGPNPLFRLISASPRDRLTETTQKGAGACIHPLMRTALHP